MRANKSWRRRLSLAMLILSISVFASYCHRPEPELLPVGEARVIAKTEDGNFIVTPAFITLTYDLAFQVQKLTLELEKCREKGD